MLPERIYFLRKKAGMKQSDLAKKLNISASTLGMYEQGRRSPNVEMLVNLSTIFDVSLDYLITGSDYKSSRSKEEMRQIAYNCPCNCCFWKNHLDT